MPRPLLAFQRSSEPQGGGILRTASSWQEERSVSSAAGHGRGARELFTNSLSSATLREASRLSVAPNGYTARAAAPGVAGGEEGAEISALVGSVMNKLGLSGWDGAPEQAPATAPEQAPAPEQRRASNLRV